MKCLICKKDHNQATLLRVDRGPLSGEWACEADIDESNRQQRAAKQAEAAKQVNESGVSGISLA